MYAKMAETKEGTKYNRITFENPILPQEKKKIYKQIEKCVLTNLVQSAHENLRRDILIIVEWRWVKRFSIPFRGYDGHNWKNKHLFNQPTNRK